MLRCKSEHDDRLEFDLGNASVERGQNADVFTVHCSGLVLLLMKI